MTTDEIKKMITDTLQGQGNQVDIGGGIPKILNAIIDSIPTKESLGVYDLGVSPSNKNFSLSRDDYEKLSLANAVIIDGISYPRNAPYEELNNSTLGDVIESRAIFGWYSVGDDGSYLNRNGWVLYQFDSDGFALRFVSNLT